MFRARRFRYRHAIMLWVTTIGWISAPPHVGFGAAGDVAFRVADGAVSAQAGGLVTSIDLFLDVDTLSSIESNAWSAGLRIVAETGTRGSVTFAPPLRVADQPNLPAATSFPFRDFDRDYGGMSYGAMGGTAMEMVSSAVYIEPESSVAPVVTSTGNLMVPSGSGLAALPLYVTSDAYGLFRIEVVAEPLLTGVAYATGDEPPNDVALRGLMSHTSGLLRVMGRLPGDANGDGSVDGYDFHVWLTHRMASGVGPVSGDFNLDGIVDGSDWSVWNDHRFTQLAPASAVPEPHAMVAQLIVLIVWARRRAHPCLSPEP